MPDTLSANLAEVSQELIAATYALIPQEAPMPSLVRRIEIKKGNNRLQIPRVNATFDVQVPTEGDELVTSSQFDLTQTTITPSLRAIVVRVSERAEYFSRDDVIAHVSKELARAQARDMDTDLLAEFANFTQTPVGSTGAALTLAVVRRGRRQLLEVVPTGGNSGGPAPMPIYLVVSPMQEEMLLANAGGQGVVSNTTPWVPEGLSQDIIDSYFVGRWFGVPVFRDGYLTPVANSFTGGMFSKEALHLAMSKDWDFDTFKVPNWIGTVIRSVADYNSGVGAYGDWGVSVLSNATAP